MKTKKSVSRRDATEGRFSGPKVVTSPVASVVAVGSANEAVKFSSCQDVGKVGASPLIVVNPENIPYEDIYWRDEDGVLVTEEVDVPIPGQPLLQRFEVDNV